MRKLLLILVAVVQTFMGLAAVEPEWQWCIDVKQMAENPKNAHPRAFMWVPPSCREVKAVLLGQNNMEEIMIMEDPGFRRQMEHLGVAMVWVSPMFDHTFNFRNHAVETLEGLLADLAAESGYAEVATAPLIGIGHSAAASFPYYMAAAMPQRVIGCLSVSGQWPYFRDKNFAPDIWGDLNIDCIPCLETMGEYESALTWANRGLQERGSHEHLALSMLSCPAEGHFASSPEKAQYLALFIAKVLQYGGHQDPTCQGWLMPRWTGDEAPTTQAAPVAEYQGDRSQAFWTFDEEMARATEQYQARYRGKQRQLVGLRQWGENLRQRNSHLQIHLRNQFGQDGRSIKVEPYFLDTVPGDSPRLTSWAHLPVGSGIGHAADGKFELRKICGPFEVVGDTLLRLKWNRYSNYRGDGRDAMTFAIWHPGDDVYRAAVQQCELAFNLYRFKNGKEQTITFQPIASPTKKQLKQSIELRATSDSGLPVDYFVVAGPCHIEGNRLVFHKLPARAKLPMRVEVVAWQSGNEQVNTAKPVTQVFYIGETNATQNLTEYVDPMIGTGAHGHTFPGAVVPHGMVQLSPDTRLMGWDACAGYHFSDNTILGFSHTHLSGTGMGDLGDITFMPAVGEKDLRLGSYKNPCPGYRQHFSHDSEFACPGYYSVRLLDDDILVELTATERTGVHRYTYAKCSDAKVIVDMEPTIYGDKHPHTEIKIVNDSTICGMKYTVGWAKQHYVYFYAVFSSPFTVQLYDSLTQVSNDAVLSANAKAVLSFDRLPENRRVEARVGLSYADIDGARLNYEAEAKGVSFEEIQTRAESAWEKTLSGIEIEGAGDKEKQIFYTALYHSHIHPSLASDADGRYRGMDQQILQDKDSKTYTVYSLWDTYRAVHPLYSLVMPSLNSEFIKDFMRKYNEAGVLPKWSLASNETGTMIAYHAVSIMGDALMKGQLEEDAEEVLKASIRSSVWDTTGITPAMNRGVMRNGIMPPGIKMKNEVGYIASDLRKSRAVSEGLEYAYCDWVIGQIARKLGKKELYKKYDRLGHNYRYYFDPETHLMRGRLSDGGWVTPFDPRSVAKPSDYVEGNSWQWSWFVPQDLKDMTKLMGGKRAFVEKLDSLFTMTSELTGDANAALDVTGMIGQYAHGNEPSHHVPYMFTELGRPDKTANYVRQILTTQYDNTPEGLCGNDDCGQMSAWYVLSAMGIYQICPANPEYTLTTPLFDRVTVHFENGRTLTIDNKAGQGTARSVKLNGKKIKNNTILHQRLMEGGVLKFE